MPESQVRIPFRDSSWVYGDGGFDMTRSFGHRLFKVKEHVDRLYRSLKYLRIDPGFGRTNAYSGPFTFSGTGYSRQCKKRQHPYAA